MYSLVAIGFVLIYKASGVFNFAQGAMVFFAALTCVSLVEHGFHFWLALPITLGAMVVLGLLIERIVLRPLVNQPPITLFMASIGRALRAVADDHQAALAVGIPLQQIWGIVWAVAGFVALVAGMLWGARNGVQYALTFLALKALPVLILGGFESIPGAIVGGLI